MTDALAHQTDIDTAEKILAVFFRYGFRKTSLDEVAREIGVSRQTVYQRYKSKKTLFHSVVTTLMSHMCETSQATLGNPGLSLIDQLVTVFDLHFGRFVEMKQNSPHVGEIIDASNELVGDVVAHMEDQIVNYVAQALEQFQIPKIYTAHNLSAVDLSRTLYYTAKGIGINVQTRDVFLKHMRIAVTTMCTS